MFTFVILNAVLVNCVTLTVPCVSLNFHCSLLSCKQGSYNCSIKFVFFKHLRLSTILISRVMSYENADCDHICPTIEIRVAHFNHFFTGIFEYKTNYNIGY